MEVVVASGNAHKVAEIQSMLPGLSVRRFDDVFGYAHSAIEDGDTFEANAIKKIEFLPLIGSRVYLADDSGLEVAALGGRPGIHSARFAGENATRAQLCQALLEAMGRADDRRARFCCVIALRWSDGRINCVSGIVNGVIASEIRGTEGFGYDPIFIPEGFTQTFSEMTPSQKNELSHRARALALAKEVLESRISW